MQLLRFVSVFKTRFDPVRAGVQRRLLRASHGAFGRALLACLWLGAGFVALNGVSHASADALVRMPPIFWLTVCAYVAMQPIADLLIFRSVWGEQAGMLAAVARRHVGNELLFGYAGDAYLFAWARHRKIAGALHAVKDVAILSAFVGHAIALSLLLPLLAARGASDIGMTVGQLSLSAYCVAALGGLIMLARGRILKLSGSSLRFIACVHLMRTLTMALLFIALWMVAAPTLGFGTCIVLAAIRHLVFRLPLVPGKDLIFAAIIVATHGAAEVAAQALTAAALGVMCVEALVAIWLAAMMGVGRSGAIDVAKAASVVPGSICSNARQQDIAASAAEVAAAMPEIIQRTIVGVGLEPPTLRHHLDEPDIAPLFQEMVDCGLLVVAASSDRTTYRLTRFGRAVSDVVRREHIPSWDWSAVGSSDGPLGGAPRDQDQASSTSCSGRSAATSRKP